MKMSSANHEQLNLNSVHSFILASFRKMADYYDYDYDQGGDGGDEEVSVENEFYNAKGTSITRCLRITLLKYRFVGTEEDGTPDEAIEAFEKVAELEEEQGEKGEWLRFGSTFVRFPYARTGGLRL